MKVTRPLLRYHGGKWMLAPWVIEHLPPHKIYVEPYGGAASVLLRKPRAHAEMYNDLDGNVVGLFRVLRDPAKAEDLVRRLALTPYAREEFAAAFEPAEDEVEAARRLVVRSFMGFTSESATIEKSKGFLNTVKYLPTGFRNNSDRGGNSPAEDFSNYPNALPAVIERLRGVCIESRPALDVIRMRDAEHTLFYVDPPYVGSTRYHGGAKKSYRHEMTDDDHRELAQVLQECKAMVVLSGYPCDLYDKHLYRDWHRVERKALADGAKHRTEVMWINPAAWEKKQGQMSLAM